MWIVFVFWVLFVCLFLPVEVEYVVENLWVTVKEELVALDNVVIAQLHLLAVVCARSQTPDPCFGIPGS